MIERIKPLDPGFSVDARYVNRLAAKTNEIIDALHLLWPMVEECVRAPKVLAPDHGFNSERSKQSENGGRP